MFSDVDDWQPAHLATPEDVAYVLFTSGTSQVKGRSSRVTDLVMEAVLEQAPHLKPSDILNARNLMDAGLDSLGFVGFTAALEEGLGLALDEQTIVELAEMPFLCIVDELKGPHGGGVLRRLRWKCGDLRGPPWSRYVA